MAATYDRTTQDSGNIVALEHVNVSIPDQRPATAFYLSGMGFTRDPYLMPGLENMWVNIGRTQLHMPFGEAQRLRGSIGVVVPDLGQLEERLKRAARWLTETRFAFEVHSDRIDATCPWGNRFRCHAPAPRFGPTQLGIAYVEFEVPQGSANGIARFYRDVMLAPAAVERDSAGAVTRVRVGNAQELLFRETAGEPPPYDRHHIQLYIADLSGPHRALAARGLITEESSEYQYRFDDIVDPDTGRLLFKVEHEVRSLRHPLYGRELVNRNPAQTLRGYVRGQDAFHGVY